MYQFVKSGSCVKRLSDGAFVPFAAGNADFVAYQEWVRLGGVTLPMPADDPKLEAQRLLAALEQATQMNRGVRELAIVNMQDLAQRQSELLAEQGIEMSPQAILAGNAFWRKCIEIDAQARALREAML